MSEVRAIEALRPPGEGLEIGVGTGRFASALNIGYGVDPSIDMLRLAGKRGVKVFCGAAESLPVRDGAFDICLMVTAIEFLEDPYAALMEARRVLKKGGHLIAAFIERESPLGKSYQARKNSPFFRGARFYSAAEVVDLLRASGFRDFKPVQTVFKEPSLIDEPEEAKDGCGEGGFCAVRAARG